MQNGQASQCGSFENPEAFNRANRCLIKQWENLDCWPLGEENLGGLLPHFFQQDKSLTYQKLKHKKLLQVLKKQINILDALVLGRLCQAWQESLRS